MAVRTLALAASFLVISGPALADTTEVIVVGKKPLPLPLLTRDPADTPQTITVIPEDVIRLAGVSDLRDVLRLDPAVSNHADEDSGQGTNVQIRGFSARNDIYIDGQLDPGSYYRDPFDAASVDVLTGPSSVIFGRGSTGGAIEIDSKSPQADRFAAATATLGTAGFSRLTADLNTPLSSTSAFRLNLMGQSSDIAGRDFGGASRASFAPSLAFGLGGATTLTLNYLHQDEWNQPDYGVPWIDLAGQGVSHPAKVSWGNFYGFTNDYAHAGIDIGTATLRHSFADGWVLHNQLRVSHYSRAFQATDPVINPVVDPANLAAVTVTRTVRGVSSTEGLATERFDVTRSFDVGGMSHTLVLGGELSEQTSDPTTLKFSGVPGTSLLAPDENQTFSGTSAIKSKVDVMADTQALFAGDSIALSPRWRFDGGVRLDRFFVRYRNTVPSTVTYRHTDTMPSWRAALTYSLSATVNLYAMAGTSFDPSAEGMSLSAATSDLKPERNRTYETGVKWQPDTNLLLSADLFDTTKINAREASPTDPTVTILAGTERAQGLELEAQGQITPQWRVLGGYTWLDARVASSPNADDGHRLQNSPRHSLHLFTSYDVTPRLTLGGGVDYSSSRVPASVPDANGYMQEVPGYATVSALARYRLTQHASLQLNADNIGGERYYDGLDDNHVNPGAGRSVRLTILFQG